MMIMILTNVNNCLSWYQVSFKQAVAAQVFFWVAVSQLDETFFWLPDTFTDRKFARRLHNSTISFMRRFDVPYAAAAARQTSQHVSQRNTFDNT